MGPNSEKQKQATLPIEAPGDASQPPNEVERNAKLVKINPEKVLAALSHLRIDRSRVKPLDAAARRGGYGVVIPAILDSDSSVDHTPGLDDAKFVAVKKLYYGTEDNENRVLAHFALEVKLLSDLSHQNVVGLIGFVEEAKERIAWIVFRWEKKGNLREFVRSGKWELPERVSLIHDVAKGLAYLHERQPPICHGDLKSLNILVNDDHRAMITDFGSARVMDSHLEESAMSPAEIVNEYPAQSSTRHPSSERLIAELDQIGNSLILTGPAWSIVWGAPELSLQEGAFPTLASDIWALAWIFWEGITGNFPFEYVGRNAPVGHRITRGELPALDTDAQFIQIKVLCNLMMDCWSLEPNGRPSAGACQRRLSLISQSVPSKDPGLRSCELLWALGKIQFHNADYNAAVKYWQEAKDVAESAEDYRGFAQCVKSLGDVHQLRSQKSEAEEAYDKARDAFSQIGDQLGFARCVQGLGDVYRMRDEYSKAEEAYIKAHDVFSQIGDLLGFAQCVRNLGEVYQMRDEYSKAEEAYIKARDVFSQIGSRMGFAQCVQSLGEVYRVRDEYPEAEEAYVKARDVFFQIGSQLGFAQCIRSLGEVYQMGNKYPQAEQAYIQARDVFSQIGHLLGFAQCVRGLGNVHQAQNEYSEAQEAYIAARDIFLQVGDQMGFAQCVQCLGTVYRLRNKYSEAEEAYITARDAFLAIGDQLGFSQCIHSLGEVYRMRDEYSEAEAAYIKARGVFSQVGNRLGFARCVQGLGHVYQEQEKYSEAEEAYIEARDVFSQIGDQLGCAQCEQGLGNAHLMRDQYAEAEDAYIKARDVFFRIGNQPGVAQAAVRLAQVHWAREDYLKTKHLFTEARKIMSSLGHQNLITWLDEQLASLPTQFIE